MDEGTKMIHPDAGRMVPTAASSASGDAVGCIGVKSILGVTVSPVNFLGTLTASIWSFASGSHKQLSDGQPAFSRGNDIQLKYNSSAIRQHK